MMCRQRTWESGSFASLPESLGPGKELRRQPKPQCFGPNCVRSRASHRSSHNFSLTDSTFPAPHIFGIERNAAEKDKKTETSHPEHKLTFRSQMVLRLRVFGEASFVCQKLGERVTHPSVHERLVELVV